MFEFYRGLRQMDGPKGRVIGLTSFLEQPICENGHGPSTPSQSPKIGF